MTRRTLLRLGVCNLLLIGSILAVIYAWNMSTSYAVSRGFSSQYFAPYVDTTIAGNPFPNVISEASKAGGTRYYQLAFITAKKGQCQALWSGTESLNYMQGDIANLRATGGDVILSFGGYAAGNPDDPLVNPQNEEELALACPNVSKLQAQYQSAIDAYRVTRVSFAISGNALYKPNFVSSIMRRNSAIARLKSGVPGTKLCVEFALPGMTTGLSDAGVVLLKDAIDKGVNICVVNILAIDYGSATPVNEPGIMGKYAVSGVKGLFNQLKFLYPRKSDREVWSMIGVTIMNGVNDSSGEGGREITGLADIQMLLQFAMTNKIRELSMWELHRDRPPKGNVIPPTDTVTPAPTLDSGIQQKPYEFSMALNTFTTSLNCPGQPGSSTPPPSGAVTPPPSGAVTPPPDEADTPPSDEANILALKAARTPASIGDSECIDDSVIASPPSDVSPPGDESTPSDIRPPRATRAPENPDDPDGVTSPSNPGSQNCGNQGSNSSLFLNISKTRNQAQVDQRVTYQLKVCAPPAGSQLIVINDIISPGLTDLRASSPNWQIIYQSASANGPTWITAIYIGPQTVASGNGLPSFTFSAKVTMAAGSVVTSFAQVVTLGGLSGTLDSSGLSLATNVTGLATAIDALPIQSSNAQ